jgi:hypothetical protein
LLFRFWVAVSDAVLLALVVPAGLMVWHGTPPPPGLSAATQPTEADSNSGDTPEDDAGSEDTEDFTPSADEVAAAATQPDGAMRLAAGAMKDLYENQAGAVAEWWKELTPQTRRRLLYGSGGGALIGLLLGLLAPLTAAGIESAVAGAMLIFFPGRALLTHWMGEQAAWLPQSPRWTVLWLGLITLVGFWLQWIISRRSTDK